MSIQREGEPSCKECEVRSIAIRGQKEYIEELETRSCRFNCRTAKENWIEGYRWAAMVADPDMRDTGESLDMEAEVQYSEYQQERRDARR